MSRTFGPFNEMDRLFSGVSRTPASVAMPMDLYRDGDSYVAEIDLPGVDPASIDIDMDGQTLTVRAERSSHTGEGTQWLTRERAEGTFARQLTLGNGLAAERISADYSDGVLRLTIPVAEAARPRKIEVRHSDSAVHSSVES